VEESGTFLIKWSVDHIIGSTLKETLSLAVCVCVWKGMMWWKQFITCSTNYM